MSKTYGPITPACDAIHAEKYRGKGESFREAMSRVASTLSDSDAHFTSFRDILLDQRFLPGGRIQAAIGSTRMITAYNCFVSGAIDDSFVEGQGSIMQRATQAAATMRFGGGIGYDFSTLRPRGELIKKLQSLSSGAVSFMDIYDAVGRATASSGHRRGAQMGVLRVDHPDIEEFIRAKQNPHRLTGFNISVAVTDEFMRAVELDGPFELKWHGRSYRTIRALELWNTIMRSTYDWSEPGVLFIDAINRNNNLAYCETISATNPCGEQPLPPFGACLLGSFNLVKYLHRDGPNSPWKFDAGQFYLDISDVVRAMDNVIDRTRYPLHEQEEEALKKRRMGLGVTGVANCIEGMGYPYGSYRFLSTLRDILRSLRNEAYRSSAILAKEKGVFPSYSSRYLDSEFLKNFPDDVFELIRQYGMRNSHLLSIAPTGTISLTADNVSSGIEPVFDYKVNRTVMEFSGPKIVEIEDYGAKFLGVRGKRMKDVSIDEHMLVLTTASRYIDSAVSKTCNVPTDISWEDFNKTYFAAWRGGCKGCTTHRTDNMRGAILVSSEEPSAETAPEGDYSCATDPATGRRSCE